LFHLIQDEFEKNLAPGKWAQSPNTGPS